MSKIALELPTLMNFEFSTPNLPELETFLTNLLSKSGCNCHFINPSKTRIILWKEVKGQTELYHLRIGIRKFLSSECLDRNGETYWKFEGREKEEIKSKPTSEPTSDPVAKFQSRQAKTNEINHGKPDKPVEQSFNP